MLFQGGHTRQVKMIKGKKMIACESHLVPQGRMMGYRNKSRNGSFPGQGTKFRRGPSYFITSGVTIKTGRANGAA
jgi:hypothetical protein